MEAAENPPRPGKQLMQEALALAAELVGELESIQTDGLAVVGLLEQQEARSKHARTRAHFRAVQARNGRLTQRAGELVAAADGLRRDAAAADYETRGFVSLERLSRADPAEIEADEAIAGERAMQTLVRTPDAVELRLAAAHIPLFAATRYYSDILTAFLGLPSRKRRSLDVVRTVAGAAALDGIGTFVPILGTVMAIHDVMQPQMERVRERMAATTRDMDRLNQLEDELDALMEYQRFADAMITLAEQGLAAVSSEFAQAEDTLAAMLDEL